MTESRPARERRWLDLTRNRLPALAEARGWPVHADHCFQRILLDHAVGGVWYDAIARRPAYAHAPDAVLDRAIAAGEAVIAGTADLHALNRASLTWRRARNASSPLYRHPRPRPGAPGRQPPPPGGAGRGGPEARSGMGGDGASWARIVSSTTSIPVITSRFENLRTRQPGPARKAVRRSSWMRPASEPCCSPSTSTMSLASWQQKSTM